jgi:hypothetical protein
MTRTEADDLQPGDKLRYVDREKYGSISFTKGAIYIFSKHNETYPNCINVIADDRGIENGLPMKYWEMIPRPVPGAAGTRGRTLSLKGGLV